MLYSHKVYFVNDHCRVQDGNQRGPRVSRLGTHYLCRSSEGLNDGLELEVIDKEEEMGDGEAGKAEDDRSEVG
jgi:hypothetical protein